MSRRPKFHLLSFPQRAVPATDSLTTKIAKVRQLHPEAADELERVVDRMIARLEGRVYSEGA